MASRSLILEASALAANCYEPPGERHLAEFLSPVDRNRSGFALKSTGSKSCLFRDA
jgi:hypothetical protein